MSNIEQVKSITLDDLILRIGDYKKNKPYHSADSIGMCFETTNNLYFFDTGTGKVFKIDPNLQEFLYQLLFCDNDVRSLQKLGEDRSLNIQEILNYIADEDLLKGTEGKKLYNDYFLQKANEEVGLKCQQLILELTGICNFRCKYCIYSSSEKGYREFNDESMSESIIKKSIDYMGNHGEEVVYITFYGGEPLVRFDLMKYAIEYARNQIKDKKLYFGFTTNLTLMSREIAAYLVQIPNLNIICSIDGPEEIHDASRVYADGKGTYKDAMKGLNILKEELGKVSKPSLSINFNAVYMVPYKKEKLYQADQNFQTLCTITPDSTYSITYPTSGTVPEELQEFEVSDNSMWEWMCQLAMDSDDLLTIKNKGVINSLTTIHQRILTKKASPVLPMNGCCIPGARRLYIDTKGDMYVCERINKSPKIGNIITGIDVETIFKKYFYEYSEHSIEHCSNCWAAKMCPVCYANRMDINGISEKAHVYCQELREQLIDQFSLYYEILETKPQKLGVLNKVITR